MRWQTRIGGILETVLDFFWKCELKILSAWKKCKKSLKTRFTTKTRPECSNTIIAWSNSMNSNSKRPKIVIDNLFPQKNLFSCYTGWCWRRARSRKINIGRRKKKLELQENMKKKKNLKADREEEDRRSRFIFINLFSFRWASSHARQQQNKFFLVLHETSVKHQIVQLFFSGLDVFSDFIRQLCSNRSSEIMQTSWFRT